MQDRNITYCGFFATMETMVNINHSNNWPSSILQIRRKFNWNQPHLAEAIRANEATASRWENGETVPTKPMQSFPEDKAVELEISSLRESKEIIEASLFPMIITDSSSNLSAASVSSGFKSNISASEQTPEDKKTHFKIFELAIQALRRGLANYLASNASLRVMLISQRCSRITVWALIALAPASSVAGERTPSCASQTFERKLSGGEANTFFVKCSEEVKVKCAENVDIKKLSGVMKMRALSRCLREGVGD